MRWLRFASLGLLLSGFSLSGEHVGIAAPLAESPSCEEECRSDSVMQLPSCDHFTPEDKHMCLQLVRARLDVCLRICEE